ncbi:hypothetical protein C9374_012946 [Naegleria lovaniensis]|uniref:RanBD1 domain-containing protein n=1 Tax=Naegleria lovaniensis TaxID=51637 RepID=A0AA88GDU9_NAELO|nr:uncharacterized protein C9374_012946 [Naegleria lovaniensis]KAG2373003.1 hypothetical protein C9374_012946 [Naegleria lovaniensis]
MSKRTNEHQLTSENFRDQDDEETEAGHFEKASEEELKERKPIKAKRKQGTAATSGAPTTTFNFAVPPATTTPATATFTETKQQPVWSFPIPSQQQPPSKPSTFTFQTTPTPQDAKDLRIKELEKRVKELESETEKLKKQLQEKKSAGAPSEATTSSSSGGFAFSFDQSATKPFAFSFPQPSSNGTANTTTATTEPTPTSATATPAASHTATTATPTTAELQKTPTPTTVEEKKTTAPTEEKKQVAPEEKKPFNFNFSSGTPSANASEPQKFSFGGFSTFSNPFSGAGSNLGESQFKFEISNKPPSWTNTDYKPKVSGANEEDEEGGEAADYEPNLPAMSHKIIDLPPVELKSGEENEKLLGEYKAAKLYRSVTVDGKSTWQQRGVGTLKINLNKNDEKDARLVIRADSVLKLILNAKVFKGMKFSPFQEQSIIFSVHKSQLCEQLTPEELSKEPEFIPHLIRFDQKNERADFKTKVESIVAKLEK